MDTKKTIRKFETNRKKNPFCPCGEDNKSGKFVPEKGYAGQNIGHCFNVEETFLMNRYYVNKEVTMFKEIEILFSAHLK